MAKRKLSDEEIKSICHGEIQSSTGWQSGELSEDRAKALDYYIGQPYGDEEEGQSKIVTREVLDTVEWCLASLMKIFTDQENMVEFSPVGEEDEEAAEQESDTVSHVYWQQNDGFLNTYTAIKDALLSKVGVLKIWWDDAPDEQREEYEGLDDFELNKLLDDKTRDIEIIEYEMDDEGNHDVTLITRSPGRVNITPCPPEEIGVNRDARSPDIQECSWVHHRVRKLKGDLVEEGYDLEKIKSIPASDDVATQERLARRYLDDEQDYLSPDEYWSRHVIYVTECYIRIDRNDDGVNELLKVTLAAGSSDTSTGSILLDIEEVDIIPFVSATPVILTHKFYGFSVADLVMEIQRIKSALLRGVITNTYLANNQRTHINDNVNMDDLLVTRPGGIIRHTGAVPPGQNVFPHPHQPVPDQVFDVMGYLDDEIKGRTGTSDLTAGLDATSLANMNTGVAAMTFDSARMKIEMIARIIAELMFRPAFRMIHTLLSKNQTKEMVVRLRSKYIDVDPTSWRERHDMTVKVGLGQASRERRLMSLEAVMAKQMEVAQLGIPAALPQQIYKTRIDFTEALGVVGAENHWQDPSQLPPPPNKPDPQMEAVKIQSKAMMMEAQNNAEKNKVEMFKIQSNERMQVSKLQSSEREVQLKLMVEDMKTKLVMLKNSADSLQDNAKIEADNNKLMLETQLKVTQEELSNEQETNRIALEQYKADLAANTQLNIQKLQSVPPQEQTTINQLTVTLKDTQSALNKSNEMLEHSRAQLEAKTAQQVNIERDDEGSVVSVNGRPIIRNEKGQMVSIG